MKGWQITEPRKIEQINNIENLSDVDSVKIRLTRALITEEDVAKFSGEDKTVKFPLTPVRAAVGQISELAQDSSYLNKGDRVFLSPVTPCGKCYHCVNGRQADCYDFSVAGYNKDGFLKDFAVVNARNVYQLPKSVEEDYAPYIDYIALAISAIDKLKIEKGEHVAIFGASCLGSIIAQLIMYYQGAPILVGDDENQLLLAKKSGVYYTVKSGSKTEKEIAAITGGRMASKVIYLSRSGIPADFAYKAAAPSAKVALVGYSYPNLKIPFGLAMSKQLTNICVTNGYGCVEAAINILSNKALDLKNYKLTPVKTESIESIFQTKLDDYLNKRPVSDVLVNLLG